MEPTVSPVDAAMTIFAALRDRDLSIFHRADHPDVVADFVAISQFRGVDAVRGFFAELFAAFPDFEISVIHAMGDGDHAVVQWIAAGSFTGAPFQGIHATGGRVELRGCDVMLFQEGKLKYNTIYYDGLGFARLIGLLPREGSAADRALTAAFNASTRLRGRIRRHSMSRR